jgi:predicted nucleotidyltransferase
MAIAANVEESIKRFVDLATSDLRLQAVYLFGSNAKGHTHEWSDIDLAIVSSDFCGDRFDDSKRLIPYILKVDTAIEVHPFRPEEFSADNPFVQEILDTGIRVY